MKYMKFIVIHFEHIKINMEIYFRHVVSMRAFSYVVWQFQTREEQKESLN